MNICTDSSKGEDSSQRPKKKDDVRIQNRKRNFIRKPLRYSQKNIRCIIAFAFIFTFAIQCRKAGTVIIDGSASLAPLNVEVCEEFSKRTSEPVLVVGVSGSGGGFHKICNRKITIAASSRKIDPSEESLCKSNGVSLIEIPIVKDQIVVVVDRNNSFIDKLSKEKLRKIFQEDQGVNLWSELNEEWPSASIRRFAPSLGSGTHEHFKNFLFNNKSKEIRGDTSFSQNNNILVQGVQGDRYAIAFFPYIYYVNHQEKLRQLNIYDGESPTNPLTLSRILYLYVNRDDMQNQKLSSFIEFYKTHLKTIQSDSGYFPLHEDEKEERFIP